MFKKLIELLKKKEQKDITHVHKWKYFKTKNKEFYKLRKCVGCRLTEMKAMGPMGEEEWCPMLKKFKWPWEMRNSHIMIRRIQ